RRRCRRRRRTLLRRWNGCDQIGKVHHAVAVSEDSDGAFLGGELADSDRPLDEIDVGILHCQCRNLEEVFLLALLLQAQSAQGCRETRQLERALLLSRVPITGREVEEAVLESEQQLLPVIGSISPEREVIDIDGAFCRKRLKSYGAGVGERLS